jgi:hypothetical protein
MPSKRRPQARRSKQPRAKNDTSITVNISRPHGDNPSSDRSFEAKKRAFDAVARMRHDGLSLDAASREAGTTPATVRHYLPAALRQSKTGRWVATKSDRYVRVLSLPGAHGPVTVRARGSTRGPIRVSLSFQLGPLGPNRKSLRARALSRKKLAISSS